MATPPSVPSPAVNIPESKNTVEVYIIDTTFLGPSPTAMFMEPEIPGFKSLNAPSYSFLIKHPSSQDKYGTVVFDLAVRKDWENSAASIVEQIRGIGIIVTVEKDVATTLRDNGQALDEVGAIIWSHTHFDHTGDPQTFPATTDLIVGPGFRQHVMPGYPTDPESAVDQKAWAGREVREIDFSAAAGPHRLRIGGFDAYDFYGDGSFYLLNTPGHAHGHMSALARTTADPPSFMLLGGDVVHHCGEFRPSPYAPLPDAIVPNPLAGHARHARRPACGLAACPGRLFLSVHPGRDPAAPFLLPTASGIHLDVAEAKRSIDKLIEADAYDNIFPVPAHDATLVGIVDYYPKPANDWMAKDWKEKARWAFLADFDPEDEAVAAA